MADDTAFATRKYVKGIITGFADNVLAPLLRQALEPLNRRLEALEQRPLQKWAGVHVAGTAYEEASVVTRGGSLWIATKATTTAPGTDGSDWTLILKRGAHDERRT